MSTTLKMNKLQIETIGHTVTVPNNSIAKLMYYLSVVLNVIQYNEYNKKFVDYEKYYNLSDEEKNKIIEFANLLKPKIFIDAHILIPNSNLVPEGKSNQFYKITDDIIGFHANKEILIGGRIVKILKVMAFKSNWLNDYYYYPLQQIRESRNRRILNPDNNNYRIKNSSEFRAFRSFPNIQSSQSSSSKFKKKEKKRNILIIIIISIVLFIIILFIILYLTLNKKGKNKNKEEKCQEDERCKKCSENFRECILCNEDYLLYEGICISYSFVVKYDITNISMPTKLLYYNSYSYQIYLMKIENKIINSTKIYKFNKTGIYYVYFYLRQNYEFVGILDQMFREIDTIREIKFNKDIHNCNIQTMKEMFYCSSNLEKVDFNEFDGNNIINLEFLFFGCKSLKKINFSNFIPKNLVTMKSMFSYCVNLTSLVLANFNTQNVIDMEEMFYGCESLISLDITNFNTKKVKKMRCMFYGCKSLISLDISNFNVENVIDMSYMFKNCISLTSLDLSNFYNYIAIDMYQMFYFCNSLKYLDIFNLDPFYRDHHLFNILANNCKIRAKNYFFFPSYCQIIITR